MHWTRALKARRPRFGRAYLLLIVSMALAALPLSLLLGVVVGSLSHDPGMGAGFALAGLVLLPVIAGVVTLVVGPFYLAWLDVLLRPSPPYFRWPYLVFVISPGVPGIALLALVGTFGGPAFPAVHVGLPSLMYTFEVVVGGWMFACFLPEIEPSKA
jgi:hypothetical protein